jgi:hypothetical protein
MLVSCAVFGWSINIAIVLQEIEVIQIVHSQD